MVFSGTPVRLAVMAGLTRVKKHLFNYYRYEKVGGRVCQVVEKCERVIVEHVMATDLRRPLCCCHLLPAVHLPELHLAGA
jgi:hypothetical protein